MERLPLECPPPILCMAFLACVPNHPVLSLGPLSPSALSQRAKQGLQDHPSKSASFQAALWCGIPPSVPRASGWGGVGGGWEYEDPRYL